MMAVETNAARGTRANAEAVSLYEALLHWDGQSQVPVSLLEAGVTWDDVTELRDLLQHVSGSEPSVEAIWTIIDRVWDDCGCDNEHPDSSSVTAFYRHPVWMLNGLFVESDEVSVRNREHIADWADSKGIRTLVDFGGGFGTLARMLATRLPETQIDIYDPYPHRVARWLSRQYTNIRFIDAIEHQYDCLVATDVLEHVSHPLQLVREISTHVREAGYLVLANCFYPVVKCHLPATFHLRYSFDALVRLMGLHSAGRCANGYARVYQRPRTQVAYTRPVRALETLSRRAFPFLSRLHAVWKTVRP